MSGEHREVHPHLLTSRHIQQALYQREGGILAPERCIAALAAAARARGAAIHENEAVTDWRVDAVSADVLATSSPSCKATRCTKGKMRNAAVAGKGTIKQHREASAGQAGGVIRSS